MASSVKSASRPKAKRVLTPPNGFVASSIGLPTVSRNKAGRLEGWQTLAWDAYETVGELRYPADWVGNVMSGARLHAARAEGNSLVVVDEGPAADAMNALYAGPQGQAEMLQNFGVHLMIAGECYLSFIGDQWYVLATGKVTQQRGTMRADTGTEGGSKPISPSDFVLRVWTPNRRDPTRPDSPVRANLGTISQIRGYDAHIDAQLQSRLSGAGVLLMPSEITFAAPAGTDPAANPAQAFMSVLGEAMLTPIQDRSSAAAIVPIVALIPGEHLEKPKLLTFWSELDAQVITMREGGIKRLALGLDIPPEVLLGVADSNHWNAWLSDESAIKAHIEPRLAVVTAALTTGYLRPSLVGEVDPEAIGDFYVIADTSSVRLRPNRSREALELYDRGELSGAATRRETGFQPEDAPEQTEHRDWLLRKVATASTSPEMSSAALAALGTLFVRPGDAGGRPPDHIRTDTAPQLDERTPPDQVERQRVSERDPVPPGLAAAAEVLLFRALERAGNRLRNVHPLSDTKAMAAHTVYMALTGDPDHLLAGSWDCAPSVLADYCDDPAGVVDVLDFYARGLLASKRTPSPVVLGTLLATRPQMIEALDG